MKVSKLFLGLLFPLFISSCLNLDFEPTFYGDAIIVSRIFEGDTVYTIDGVVQANVVMDTAYLYDSKSNLIGGLKNISYDGSIFELSHLPQEYTTEPVEAGSYSFRIDLEDGTTYNVGDYVSAAILYPFEITEVAYDTIKQVVKIEWADVDKADYFNVRIFKDGVMVLNSPRFNASYTSTEIGLTSYSWLNNFVPAKGDSLTTTIMALQMESSSDIELQSVSFSNTTGFIWGD